MELMFDKIKLMFDKDNPKEIDGLYFYFDDFPYYRYLPDNEYDRFWELNPSNHMLDDKEYEELRQLAQKAIDTYDSLPD